MPAVTPQPLWKLLSFLLPLTLCGVTPVLLFMRHPNYMLICTSIFSFFIALFLLNCIIPDNQPQPCQRRLAPSQYKLFFWILFTELFIFLLSHNFSIFAFNLSEQKYSHSISLPHWPIWLGLWAYFSTIITMQHYAHYHLRQANFSSGLCFIFKNTYLDIAIKRVLGGFNFGLNLIGIYLLIISVIFIILEFFQLEALQNFHITSLLFFGLFFYFNTCTHKKKVKRILNRTSFPNIFYIFIASLCCTIAIWISSILSQHFFLANIFKNIIFVSEKTSPNPIDPAPFLFIAMFVLVTPMFASLIVKHAVNVSRKKLLLLSFFLPNLFYLILSRRDSFDLVQALNNKILFVVMVIIFLAQFSRGKTTEDFMSGALPLPKQRAILPANSYLLFPANCLVLFNFYLLVIIIGPVSLYAITATASLLSVTLGTVGICSYFGKTYRLDYAEVLFLRHQL